MSAEADNPPGTNKKEFLLRRKKVRQDGQPLAVDLIEEGVHLLRQTSVTSWALYLSGIAPFVVGFLFFWTEMASSGLAKQVLLPGATGLAMLFVWLKVTQVYFAHGMREALHGKVEARWTFRNWIAVVRRQMFWQPTGLLAVPVAFILTIPFAWVFTFYQNLTVLDPREHEDEGEVARESWRLSRLWHEQNWMLLTLLSLVFLLSFINWMTLMLAVPYLLKTLLGIETVFSRAGIHMLNSISIFGCALLAYVVTDPLVKAVYLLRLHYCESRRSGADLILRLRRSVSRHGVSSVALPFLVLSLSPLFQLGSTDLVAQSDLPESIETSIEVEQLDGTIEQVLQRREFVWRFPRDEMAGEAGEKTGWFRSLMDTLERWQEHLELWLEELFDLGNDGNRRDESSWGGFPGLGSFLSYLLIAIFVILVIYFAVKALRMYQPLDTIEALESDAVDVVPDLSEDEVAADLLPRNRWVEMAHELIAKGELRLALRAYFLAQLSALSSEGLIVIRLAKSNREYAREIARRAHGQDALLDIYKEQVRLFESIWYGERITGPEEISAMEGHLTQTGVLT